MGFFDTPLTPEQEGFFAKWAGKRAGDTQDYDLRGFFAAGGQNSSGHLPDTYKKPNHPTFSNESQYSTPEQTGGQWVQAPDGKWVFMASPWNMNTQPGLQGYFDQREPDSTLVLPIDYRLPSR